MSESADRSKEFKTTEFTDATSGAPLNRRLLEEIMRQTATANTGGNSSELAPFLEVAAKHAGSPFSIDPVGVELVEVALQDYVGKLMNGEECRSLATRIAKTLWEDPQTRTRMEEFWSRLAERST